MSLLKKIGLGTGLVGGATLVGGAYGLGKGLSSMDRTSPTMPGMGGGLTYMPQQSGI